MSSDDSTKYAKYSSEIKIKIQLAKRNVFNLELNATEKVLSSRKFDKFEEKVIEYHQNFLQEKVWMCERDIYFLYDNLPENYSYIHKIRKKIEAENVAKWPYESEIPILKIRMTEEEYNALSPQERIKERIMLRNLNKSELHAIEIKQRESEKINQYEKAQLAHYSSMLNISCRSLERKIYQLYYADLPKNYPYRKELKEEMEEAKITFQKDRLKSVLQSKNPQITGFLQEILTTELPEIISVLNKFSKKQLLYKIEILEVLKKKLPYIKELLEKIPKEELLCRRELLEEILKAEVLDSNYLEMHKEKIDERTRKEYHNEYFMKNEGFYNYVYNYQVLNHSYDMFSPKKKIEVGIANHYVLNLQLNAVVKWRTSREMDEYEKTISVDRYNTLQYALSIWDREILYNYYRELRPDTPYLNDIREKFEAANINEQRCESKIMFVPPSELTLNYKKLPPQDQIKYFIIKHSLISAECDTIRENYKPRKLSGYEQIIFRSICAKLTKEVLAFDNNIYCIFHEDLPKDYPDRKELLEKIRNAKVSDKIDYARLYSYRM